MTGSHSGGPSVLATLGPSSVTVISLTSRFFLITIL